MAAASPIYQLKITLRGSKPPIWRRVEVPGSTKLSVLSDVILAAMGWDGGHLHMFNIGGREYCLSPRDYGFDDALSEKQYSLAQVAPGEKAKFTYEYDFGDSWDHTILVEKIVPREKGVTYPRCTAGKMACPPEDCGGLWGYYEMLEALKDPDHPEHEDFLEWSDGEEIDPEYFDVAEVNERMRSSV